MCANYLRRPLQSRAVRLFRTLLCCSVACCLSGCGTLESASEIAIGDADGPPEVESTALLGPYFLDQSPGSTTTAKHSFILRNDSAHDITLKYVGKTCGCVEHDLGDGVVSAGKVRRVTVGVDLAPATGRKIEGIVLEANEGSPRRVRLNLDCYCYARLAVFPSEPVKAQVSPGSTQVMACRVAAYRPTGEASAPLSVVAHGPGIQARIANEHSRELSGEVFETLADLVVELTATAGDASDLAARQCRITVAAGRDQVNRAFTWTPATPIRLMPERLLVQPVAGGSSGRFRLRADHPFRVLRIESSVAWLTAITVSDAANSEHFLAVNSVPLEHGAAARGQLTIYTDHPAQPTILASVFALSKGRSQVPLERSVP